MNQQVNATKSANAVGKLEANPCGQWDWIQHATGLPIANAIADELLGATV